MKSSENDLWFEPHEAVGGMTYQAITEPPREIRGYVSYSGRTVAAPWSVEHYPIDVQLVMRRQFGWPETRPLSALENILCMFLAGCLGLGLMALAMWFDGVPVWRR